MKCKPTMLCLLFNAALLSIVKRRFDSMRALSEERIRKEKRFTADASHELRTSIAVMLTHSEALMDLRHDRESEMLIRKINRESKRMHAIISNLLMLARGDAGQFKAVNEEFDLNLMIDVILDQMEDYAKNSAIKLKKDFCGGLTLTSDQSLLTQLLLNIIENAIKYGRHGGFVCVKARRQGRCVILSVEDDGIGMSKEELSHIFERFYRGDKSRDRSGAGLGLSIVRLICGELGAKITVKSKVGAGSLFTVTIPDRRA